MLNLYQFAEILENNPLTLATVDTAGQPNIAVAANIKIISENQLLIAHNEMVKTITNVKNQPKVCLTCFNKDWQGVRIYGEASYFNDGPYFEQIVKFFGTESNHPKGVILIIARALNPMK